MDTLRAAFDLFFASLPKFKIVKRHRLAPAKYPVAREKRDDHICDDVRHRDIDELKYRSPKFLYLMIFDVLHDVVKIFIPLVYAHIQMCLIDQKQDDEYRSAISPKSPSPTSKK